MCNVLHRQKGILIHGWGYPFLLVLLSIMVVLPGCSDPVEPKKNTAATERPEWMAAPEPAKPPIEKIEKPRALLIGVVGPETGKESYYGLQTLAGVQQAAAFYNAKGGIRGQPLEVVHFDNQGDLGSTEEIVQDLIQKQVIAIIAAPSGWSTFAPTRLANASHTIFMAVATRRRIARSGPYVFRLTLPDETAVDDLIRQVISKQGYQRFALVTSSLYDHSLALGSAFKQSVLRHGGEIIVEADTYDTYTGKPDLPAVIKALQRQVETGQAETGQAETVQAETGQAETVQAVFFTGADEEGADMAVAMRQAGLQLPLLGGEDLFTPKFLERGGDAVTGTILFSTYAPDSDDRFPNRIAALAYDAFISIATAITNTGSTMSSKVRETLLTTVIEGVTGKVGFTQEGETVKQPFFYQVTQQNNPSKLGFVRFDPHHSAPLLQGGE